MPDIASDAMRLAPLFALMMLASAAHAQAVPDPTNPAHYYPLGVGDRWEYAGYGAEGAPFSTRRTVVGDTSIGGRRWAVLRDQTFRFTAPATWESVGSSQRIVRFDTAAANVIRWTSFGEGAVYDCRLDLPLTDGTPVDCVPGFTRYTKRVAETGLAAGRLVLSIGSSNGFGASLAAGIGEIREDYDLGSGYNLVFARVGGETFGTPIAGMPNVPDPTPPEAYYPLQVGNQWEYRDYDPQLYPDRYPYERVTVTKDTVVAGRRYFALTNQRFQSRGGGAWIVRESRLLVRFDTSAANVKKLYNAGTSEGDLLRCRLDLPIPEGGVRVPCADSEYETYSVLPGEAVGIGSTVLSTTVRTETLLYFTTWFAAGVGRVGLEGCEIFCTDLRIEYARVDGVEYGQKLAFLPNEPVAEVAGSAPAAALALRAAPNPTAGALALTVTLPEAQTAGAQTVVLEAFDALGRRVWQADIALAAGPQTVAVDASTWAPGVYVVRATAGRASVAVCIVRR